ncbi:alpha/beta fold hydrolase [Proteinivorax tanatarense]|uniref:Alpha/beta fold hydrolase n=1 Tax=Proteinivorax tanatarense TaxID=1260629 RepID=A0AAU7VKH1_9FIRM
MKKIYFKALLPVLIICIIFAIIPSYAQASSKNPVVFVHGYFDSTSDIFGKSNFSSLKNYLIEQGWPKDNLYVIQFSSITGSNVNNAHELSKFINDILSETGSKQVDIVAHSMGGLSSRYYVNQLGGVDKVGSLITIGTPHYGTPQAYLASWSAGGREMIPRSIFLNYLNNDLLTPGNIHYTSIYTYLDEVVPYRRSRIDGWNNVGGFYNLHITMLMHNSVHEIVRDNLSQ